MVSQSGYEISSLRPALLRAIDLAGFDLESVSGKKVLLKPNMLGAYPPEMGVTTHPSFVEAVAGIFREAGAIVSLGDSPNGIYALDRVWNVTGLRNVCRVAAIAETRFEASGSVEKNGIRIARAIFDADMVVNLPKFKTHGLTILTLAVKNLFGCVNGMQKTIYHRQLNDSLEFAELLVRVADAVRPALTLVDGIVAMEGDGPSSGRLTNLGIVVAGTDVHAVDAACCRIVGLEPSNLDTLAAARKLGSWDDKLPVEIVGDKIKCQGFKLPATYTRGMRDWWISRFVLSLIWSGVSAKPVINSKICEKCFNCLKACPIGAITKIEDGAPPVIDLKKCIQCFCCHEVCPYKSIYIRQSLLVRIANLLNKFRTKKGT